MNNKNQNTNTTIIGYVMVTALVLDEMRKMESIMKAHYTFPVITRSRHNTD